MKKRTRKNPVFSQDDILNALSLIAGAMHRAQAGISDATTAHTEQFLATLRRLGIERDTLPHEPYLEQVQANAAYLLISRLETLFVRTESYLMVHQNHRKGISFYHPESIAMKQLDVAMQWKEIDPHTSLAQQMGKRAMQEEQSIHARLHQHLDARRQIGVGIERFMWTTQGDERVRSSHDARNGQIFSWATGPYPGAEAGCRCHAAPVAMTQAERERLMAVDPSIEPVYPIESLLLIGRIGGLSVAAARKGISGILARITDRLARARQPKLRRDYEREVRNLVKVERHMRKEGHDVETIARELSKQRRALGVKYKDMTPEHLRPVIKARNIRDYNDELGPTIDYFRSRGYSWEKIIEKSKRPGGKDLRGDFKR